MRNIKMTIEYDDATKKSGRVGFRRGNWNTGNDIIYVTTLKSGTASVELNLQLYRSETIRVGNNLVADKTLNALYGFADDGRTQMADMHFFCHIRRTKIQNDIFRFFDFVAA